VAASAILEHFRAHGYARVEHVVDAAHVRAILAALHDATGVDRADPATWAVASAWPPLWAHQAQWDCRQHPAVHRAFADVWGREDLISSQDGVGVKPPLTTRSRAAQALSIHWDLDPRHHEASVQGVLYLTDVSAEHGAFCCVPALFADLDGWLARHPGAGTQDIDLEGHEIVPVPGRAGDLVLFSSRLPHGNGENVAATPRVVQYIAMWPAGFWGDTREDHAERYRSGTANPEWRSRPGWDHPQPGPAAALTPLGRRLAGVDAWPRRTRVSA
jgi:ectoine hydroxylase-related dioxygenase (phytanoyl-CoA dioxygenase family)